MENESNAFRFEVAMVRHTVSACRIATTLFITDPIPNPGPFGFSNVTVSICILRTEYDAFGHCICR